MGIDFTHCEAHWAYSGFHTFRTRLAAEIGIVLDGMEGFGGGNAWGDLPPDPIIELLEHSDCDGTLSPDACRRIAPRLRELVASWPSEDYDKQHAFLLASGMDKASNAGEDLEFI